MSTWMSLPLSYGLDLLTEQDISILEELDFPIPCDGYADTACPEGEPARWLASLICPRCGHVDGPDLMGPLCVERAREHGRRLVRGSSGLRCPRCGYFILGTGAIDAFLRLEPLGRQP